MNSQPWKTPLPGETDQQVAWLARTLESAARKRQRIFIVMHYPLFVNSGDSFKG